MGLGVMGIGILGMRVEAVSAAADWRISRRVGIEVSLEH